MRGSSGLARVGAAALLLGLCAPAAAQQQGPPTPYMGALIGAHAGVDYLFDGFVLGAQSVLLLDPWGKVALVPNGEFEFRRGLRDWQANGDVAVMPFRGIFAGGGVSYRNSVFDEDVGRETLRGYSLFFGYREPPRPGRISPQVELRWSFIGEIRPRTLTLGANYPLLLFR